MKEPYRGQDRTLEMIKNRNSIIQTRDETPAAAGYDTWSQACKELYSEMVAEGLRTTADEILKHIALEPGQEIVKTSDSFRIVRKTTEIPPTVIASYDEDGEPVYVDTRTIGGVYTV